MNNLWGIILTVILYGIIQRLKKIPCFKFINSNLTTGLIIIIILIISKTDYTKYNETACYLTLLLGPATIALAYPLSENIELLTKNKRAIYSGFIIATLTALVTSFILGKFFNAARQHF